MQDLEGVGCQSALLCLTTVVCGRHPDVSYHHRVISDGRTSGGVFGQKSHDTESHTSVVCASRVRL